MGKVEGLGWVDGWFLVLGTWAGVQRESSGVAGDCRTIWLSLICDGQNGSLHAKS